MFFWPLSICRSFLCLNFNKCFYWLKLKGYEKSSDVFLSSEAKVFWGTVLSDPVSIFPTL